jgi:hypothetical protein
MIAERSIFCEKALNGERIMLDEMISAYGNKFLVAALGVALALLCLFIVLWLMRNRASSPFVRGGRNRQPRLQVLDAAAVDARRRIVLIRRDNVEHLVMIGGPTDIVIESGIGDDRGYLSALTVQPPAPEAIAIPPHAEAAKIGAEPASRDQMSAPIEAPVAPVAETVDPAPVRIRGQQQSTQASTPMPTAVRAVEPAATTPMAPKTPVATPAAPTSVYVPAAVAAPVAPIVAATAIPVMTAQAVSPSQDAAKPADQSRPIETRNMAEARPEPRLEVVETPVPVTETVETVLKQAPGDVISTAATAAAVPTPITVVPAVTSEPPFNHPENLDQAPAFEPLSPNSVMDLPAIKSSPDGVASSAAPPPVADVTAPQAASILDTARARVLPTIPAASPAVVQPFEAGRFSPRLEPLLNTQDQLPPRDMSDFERVLEEEMALHLAADPLPLTKSDRPATPVSSEIRSDRPVVAMSGGVPMSAVLPEVRHTVPQVDKNAPNTAATPDEPNLQNEIARIFGEMSASRNS